MNKMSCAINKISKIGEIGEINKLEEIDAIKNIMYREIDEISLLLKAINNYFDNPGKIAAHRQMKGQEGGAYVWTSAHQTQQRASHNWHDAESVMLAEKRCDAIRELEQRRVAVQELTNKYVEERVLTTEWAKRNAAIEKLKARRAEIVEQEILCA